MADVTIYSYYVDTSYGKIHVQSTFPENTPDNDQMPVYISHGNSGSSCDFFRQVTKDFSPDGMDDINEALKTAPLNDFAKSRRVVLIDLPGHGLSPAPLDPQTMYNIPAYGQIMLEVAAKISGERAKIALFGQSLSGHAAIFAAKQSDNVAKLILSGTPPVEISFEENGFGKGFNFNPELGALFSLPEFTEDQAKTFMKGAGYDVERYPFIWKDAQKTNSGARPELCGSIAQKMGGDQATDIKALNIPVCIIHGKDDRGVRFSAIQEVEKDLKNGEVHEIDGEHSCYMDNFEQFNEIFFKFVGVS